MCSPDPNVSPIFPSAIAKRVLPVPATVFDILVNMLVMPVRLFFFQIFGFLYFQVFYIFFVFCRKAGLTVFETYQIIY